MQLQPRWVEAAAAARDGADFASRLEEAGVFVRVDPSVEPHAFRGATISEGELESLRTIEYVVRARRVRRITRTHVTTDLGDLPATPGEVYVDCTAAGVPCAVPRPIFERGRLTIQYVTVGLLPWSAATIALVEAIAIDDEEKNGLCPPVVFTGDVSDLLQLAHAAMNGQVARSANGDLAAWNHASRLNPARAAPDHMDDPRVAMARSAIRARTEAALQNLDRRATTVSPSRDTSHASAALSAPPDPENA
jgi:hypothetical protein